MNRKPRARLAIIFVLLLGLGIFGGVYYAWNTTLGIFQPANPSDNKPVSFAIAKGDTTADIADNLYKSHLIRDPLAFRLWARIKGLDTRLQAGVYKKLTPSMTISQIIDQLLDAQPEATRVIIPEGLRLEQIAKKVSVADPKLIKFKEDEFLNYVKHIDKFPDAGKYTVLQNVPAGRSMEGLLFPLTYDVPVDANAADVVHLMLDVTQRLIDDKQLDLKGQAEHHNLSLYQVFILASLVEREVRFDEDRPGVASVFWNRVQNPTYETVDLLQSDPSVQYARDTQTPPQAYWTNLADVGSNVAKDSPWNTYTHKGWPPTPICSPGLDSLKAAASPLKSDNFYFLGKKDGHIVFAKNKADFDKLVQQYLK